MLRALAVWLSDAWSGLGYLGSAAIQRDHIAISVHIVGTETTSMLWLLNYRTNERDTSEQLMKQELAALRPCTRYQFRGANAAPALAFDEKGAFD